MKGFIKIVLFIINIIFFIGVLIFEVICAVDLLLGAGVAQELLQRLGITLSYNIVMLIGILCLVILIGSYIARKVLPDK